MVLSKEDVLDEGDFKSSEEEIMANKFNIVNANGGSSMDDDDNPVEERKGFTINGSDGASAEFEKASARLMKTVQDILDGDKSATQTSVPIADQRSLDLLRDYSEYHITIDHRPTPLPILRSYRDLNKILSDPWDVKFLQPLSAVETINLLHVADVLNVGGLLDILRAFFVSQFYGCSDEELKKAIKENKWPHETLCGGEDVELSASEDDDNDDNIRGLDEVVREEEKEEQQAPVLLKPTDFHTMKDVVAQKSNAILRLQKLVNEQNIEENCIFAMSDAFYQSLLNYSLYHPDLTVSLESLKLCKLAMNVMVPDTRVMDIKDADSKTLKLVVTWLKYHNGVEPAEIAKPIRSVKMSKIVEDTWDATFIDSLDKRTLFQLILSANYMDIKSLLHLGCAKVATMIKGKSPEEIRVILGEEEQ